MSTSNGFKTLEIKPDQVLTEKQQDVIKILKVLLADEFVLHAKLRNYYWNVTSTDAYSLHAVFEIQITDTADLAELVANQICQYGANAIGTMDEFLRNTHLFEEPGVYPDAQGMVANLVTDHEAIIRFLRKDIEKISREFRDVRAVDLLTGILEQHEQMAWMLRMCLEGQTPPGEA